MDRTERLDLLLRTLADRPGATAAELAERLGTSARSVFRDVAYLRERGYPIEASRGRGGGLRLHPSWGLRRVQLSPDEAIGALLGLAVMERIGLPLFAGGLATARRKLVEAFPASDRRRLSPLRDRILIGPQASAQVARSYGVPDRAAVRALEGAFLAERMVRAEYAREDGQRSERRLEPHALLLNWPAWYLLAHDHSRAGVRTFRLDRFRSVAPLEERFRARPAAMLAGITGFAPEDARTWRL